MVTGKGFPRLAQILVIIGAATVASTKSDGSGNIVTTFTVPAGMKVGQQIVRSAVASSGAASLTVVPPKPVPGDSFTYR